MPVFRAIHPALRASRALEKPLFNASATDKMTTFYNVRSGLLIVFGELRTHRHAKCTCNRRDRRFKRGGWWLAPDADASPAS
jgi:hypothetical protein